MLSNVGSITSADSVKDGNEPEGRKIESMLSHAADHDDDPRVRAEALEGLHRIGCRGGYLNTSLYYAARDAIDDDNEVVSVPKPPPAIAFDCLVYCPHIFFSNSTS